MMPSKVNGGKSKADLKKSRLCEDSRCSFLPVIPDPDRESSLIIIDFYFRPVAECEAATSRLLGLSVD